MSQRLKVLMIAYACDPEGGGEHWLGWGWAREAAKHHDVTLLSTSRAAANLRKACSELGIEFHEVALPKWIRALSDRLGTFGVWLRKFLWQNRVLAFAKKLHLRRPFDLVHQTTFHTFRVPFACAGRLGIPSVWGPLAGGESTPPGFSDYMGKFAAAEEKRAALNHYCLRLSPIVRSLRNASAIILSNRTTLSFIPSEHHAKCHVMAPNALRDDELSPCARVINPPGEALSIVFAGACAPTRAMPLVFEALSKGIGVPWTMNIAGAGPALEFWKQEAVRLGVADRVTFLGQISRDTLNDLYNGASVLVFPALRDSGGSAILDAMTMGIPILTLNWAGPGEMVDSSCALLARTDTPAITIQDIRYELNRLATEPGLGQRLTDAALQRAIQDFSWAGKFAAMNAIYQKLTSAHAVKQSTTSV